MDTNKSTSTKQKAAFNEFSWNKEGAGNAKISSGPAIRLADKIKNQATGLGVILELIEHDLILHNPRLLNDFQIGALMRLAIETTNSMNTEAEDLSDVIERDCSPLESDLH